MVVSEFQASLIGAGVAVVVAIFAFNKWQESRHKRMAEKILKPDHPDVLLEGDVSGTGHDGQRLEPSLIDGDVPPAPRSEAIRSVPEEVSDWRPAPAEHLVPVSEIVEPPLEQVGELTDCIVKLECNEPVAAHLLWPAQQDALPRLAKPFVWLGLNEKKPGWDVLNAHSAGRYRRFAAALQLVDRQGPVSPSDVQSFLVGMNQLAERFSANLHLPDLESLDARAADLDQFCAGVDVQIGVNVITRSGASITGTKLRGLAEATGFTLQGDGAFHFLDDDGHCLFTLTAKDGQLMTAETLRATTVAGICISLDVPRVLDGGTAFTRMNSLALQLAQAMNGVVVDDNRAPLDERAIGIIKGKITEFQQTMAQRGIVAGGPLAQRLFS